jgi:hypothetical protein
MFTIVALVCALATSPDHCGRATALYQDQIGEAPTELACMSTGMLYAAAKYEIDAKTQYAKIQCIRSQPDLRKLG